MHSNKKCLMTVLVTILSMTNISARAVDAPPTVSTARQIIAEAHAVAPGGIDELKTVELGDIPQWISVRGNNPDYPILLFIQGGSRQLDEPSRFSGCDL